MLADLFNAPGETTGARTQGSSEAIMLGALSLKWKWRQRREAAGRPADQPNLVFGGDVHVVWEKFCRYFDVEPRIVPLQEGKYTIGPADVEPHVDENTIGVAAVLGTTFTGHKDDIDGINDLLVGLKRERDLDVPLYVDGARGGFVWPFLYPHSEWDFLGKTDATFTLNFSTGSAMVLAQYYNLVRYGRDGYTYVMQGMQQNAAALAEELRSIGEFELIGEARSSFPWSPGSWPSRRTTTSSTSPGSSRPSGAGWSPPTRCRPTRGT
jgi:glutamate decarboxylase